MTVSLHNRSCKPAGHLQQRCFFRGITLTLSLFGASSHTLLGGLEANTDILRRCIPCYVCHCYCRAGVTELYIVILRKISPLSLSLSLLFFFDAPCYVYHCYCRAGVIELCIAIRISPLSLFLYHSFSF